MPSDNKDGCGISWLWFDESLAARDIVLYLAPSMRLVRVGQWTILDSSARPDYSCVCWCGTRRNIYANNILSGKSKSCGCEGKRYYKQHLYERRAFALLRYRCLTPTSPDYKNYGGRGITVTPRWDLFENFFDDMGPAPTKKHTVDRIDVNGPYCKENCRWATNKQQSRNRRGTRYLTTLGEKVPLIEACEAVGIGYTTVRERLRRGWTESEALSVVPLAPGARLRGAG